jgi:DNA invertase Pin-like site-specific DNA recombinase
VDGLSYDWQINKAKPGKRAVAYYRHSAQDKQENSIEIQREQVRKFAAEHSIEIIREFADHGISGLSTEKRDGFNEMLHDYVEKPKEEIDNILVLDVSRWGRFQDLDLSGYYSGLCAFHNKRVVFTTIGIPKQDDLLYGVQLSIERYRAASYSRELSGKVWKGCSKIASDGFWAGGKPPYGMYRLLLDEQRNPVRVLKSGEHKAIHNQRVILTPGDQGEIKTIKRIFELFVEREREAGNIASSLNNDGIPSPGNGCWNKSSVYTILMNEIYAGAMVWNKTSKKMTAKMTHNPTSEWVKTQDAFKPIVVKEIFYRAQELIRKSDEERLFKYSDENMLAKLKHLYDSYGTVSGKLISSRRDMVSPGAYASHFRSINMAYQAMHKSVIDERRKQTVDLIRKQVYSLDDHEDFVVIDDYASIHIQPAVPFPYGYEAYWSFRPDMRVQVDMTLGIPLTNSGKYEVLGYVIFPRMLSFKPEVNIQSTAIHRWDIHAFSLSEVVNKIINRSLK